MAEKHYPILNLAAVLVACLIFSGCPQKAEKPKSDGKTAVQKQDSGKITAESVLIRCGTNELTMADVTRQADLFAKMMQFAMPGKGQLKANSAIVARVLSSSVRAFPVDCAIAAFAATNNIAPSAKDISLMRKNVMHGAKQDFISWSSFAKKFTADELATLESRIWKDALIDVVRRWHSANYPVRMSDEEIAKCRTIQREYNALASATNDATFALATNVWKEIKAGMAFEEAVERYSNDENETEHGEWGDFRIDYFNDNPVLKAVVEKLEVGEISQPVEGDNGLMILRLDDRQTNDGGLSIYSLSRVFLHLPEFYPELDDASFKAEILKARQDKMFGDFVNDLAKKLPVSYPSGEAIFESAKRTAAQPAFF